MLFDKSKEVIKSLEHCNLTKLILFAMFILDNVVEPTELIRLNCSKLTKLGCEKLGKLAK